MTTVPTGFLSVHEKMCESANLCEGWVIIQGDPQRLDANFRAAVSAFPYIGKAAEGDRFIADSGKIAGYCVRMVRSCCRHK